MRREMLGVGGLAALALLLAACAAGFEAGPGSPGTGTPSGGAAPGAGGGAQPGPGVLTAGDWDDNLNFPLFQKYLGEAPQKLPGLPAFPSSDRVLITVRDAEGKPVPNARVTVREEGVGKRLEAPTATDGRLVFLPGQDGARQGATFTVTVAPPPGQQAEPLTTSVQGTTWELTLPGVQGTRPAELDLAFVVDATGSMGDELEYLKAELQAIARTVRAEFPQVSTRFALVMYRDDGDEYVVRTFDFTPDLGTFQQRLDAQRAHGGGDYPEAMERALGALHQLTWREGNTARLAFLVADAPPHTQHSAAFLHEANRARLSGIKVYPVAASGVAQEAEYLMRIAAQLTLGRYIFLTDDSGVGGPHEEPTIPCYQVQSLKNVLTRAVTSELAGQRQPVPASDVLRSVGNPQDGVCTLEDGTKAYL